MHPESPDHYNDKIQQGYSPNKSIGYKVRQLFQNGIPDSEDIGEIPEPTRKRDFSQEELKNIETKVRPLFGEYIHNPKDFD